MPPPAPDHPLPRAEADALLQARLTAQRLAGAPADSPIALTRHLLAVQAQDLKAARLAIRARTADTVASDVDHALGERSLVVTWLCRGTLHLVAAEDEPWLFALTTPQLRTVNARRLEQEGVSPAQADRGVATIARTLAAEGPSSRARLRTALDADGAPTARQAFVHVVFRASLDGLIVRGPVIAGEQTFVLAGDWLGPRPTVDRDVALGELARRYLRGHGPADDRDLAKWAGIGLRDARRGLERIAGELQHRRDGLVALAASPPPAPLPALRLLGPFDPLLLGWRSRQLVLTDRQEVVTVNGIIRAIVLEDGRAVGTWTLPAGRPRVTWWEAPDPPTERALKAEAERVVAFLAG